MPDDLKPEGSPTSEGQPQPVTPPAPAAAPKPAAPAAPKAPAVMAATPWEGELPAALKQTFGERIRECSSYLGQNFIVAAPDAVVPIIEHLKASCGFDYLVDVTAVDYPKNAERFEVVWILYSFARNERLRIKASFKEGAKPASATGLHLTANWLEREVYDMFGIEFEGHPDLRRILMPDDWSTFPLRKDSSILNMDQRWVQENIGIESGQ